MIPAFTPEARVYRKFFCTSGATSGASAGIGPDGAVALVNVEGGGLLPPIGLGSLASWITCPHARRWARRSRRHCRRPINKTGCNTLF